MNKLNQKLSEVLDVEPIGFEILPAVVKTPVEDDSEFARQNIRDLIEKGNTAIDSLLHVAKESEHPRAYEVAAALIKNLSDLNKDLLEVQKRKKDLVADKGSSKDVNIDKAVFVGSTAELMKLIKANK